MILESLALSTADKTSLFYELVVDSEIQPDIRYWFDSMLITSELKPIKRIAELETVTGLNDFADFEDEEREPNIPERIETLEESINTLNKTVKPELIDRSLVAPSKNITEIRADFLNEYITTNQLIPKGPSIFANIETRVVDSKEFRYFVNHILPSEYRPESTKNLRKMKRDVFNAAVERSGAKDIFVDQADHGREELRLIWARQFSADEEKELLIKIGMISTSLQTVTA
jgi:hypothetical protein